ncbi:MAG: hypothetical protein ABEJ62_02535 [Candidatus Nanohaloarchaea archaeon]
MDSRRLRQVFAAVLAAFFGLLAFYGVYTGSVLPAVSLLSLTLLLFASVKIAEEHDPHLLNMVQEESYRITLKSVVATSFLTGMVFLFLVFAASAIIGTIFLFASFETVSTSVLADAVGRLQLLLNPPLPVLTVYYTGLAISAGFSFWLLYPYLPPRSEEFAAPVSFVIAWAYLLSAASIFVDIPYSSPAFLGLDAAIIAAWGHFFSLAYEDVEKYVP